MRVLITGGAGFIGRNLKNSLQYDLTIITRNDCDLTNCQSVDDLFKNKFFDVVIHAAVVGGSRLAKDDSSVLDKNLTMYLNILNNRSHFNKFINFGSGSTSGYYGLSKYVIKKSLLDKPDFYNIRIFAVF